MYFSFKFSLYHTSGLWLIKSGNFRNYSLEEAIYFIEESICSRRFWWLDLHITQRLLIFFMLYSCTLSLHHHLWQWLTVQQVCLNSVDRSHMHHVYLAAHTDCIVIQHLPNAISARIKLNEDMPCSRVPAMQRGNALGHPHATKAGSWHRMTASLNVRPLLERQTQLQDISDQVSDQVRDKEISKSLDRAQPRAPLEYPISKSVYGWFKTGAEEGCQNEKETDFLS